MVKNVKHTETETICLNDQTVGNLKKYLARFPDDAKVVIHCTDKSGSYHNYDCQIGCNFDYQEENNTVQFCLGFPVDL